MIDLVKVMMMMMIKMRMMTMISAPTTTKLTTIERKIRTRL